MTRRHRTLFLSTAIAATLLLSACGGSSSTDSGVASLADSTSTSTATAAASSAVTEKEALAYVECLRGQGLDLPDPTVDADGNVTMGRPTGDAGTGNFDRDAFTKAQETCGEVPEGLVGNRSEEDMSALQDAALKYAECLRGEGLDVADPDFSGGGLPGGGGEGGGEGGGGPFGDLDQDDPKVVAAQEACQSILAEAGVGPGSGS